MTDQSPREEIGERLRAAREYVGLTQEDVAQVLGLPRSALSLIENGLRKVDTLELSKFASLYEQSIDSLAGTASTPPLPESVRALARAATELPPSDQSELLRFAEYLQARRLDK